VRLLLVHDGSSEVPALLRTLSEYGEVRSHLSLGDALRDLTVGAWQPDFVIMDFKGEPGGDLLLLGCLRDAVGQVPIVFGAGNALPLLRARSGGTLVHNRADRKPDLMSMLESLIEQQRVLNQVVVSQRASLTAEVERSACAAAEAAVDRAMAQIAAKLGVEDTEGLKLAIRFARGWEEAKQRFVSALTTGIASAFLLALGAGIIALLRNGSAK
jgi:hypothetical protein